MKKSIFVAIVCLACLGLIGLANAGTISVDLVNQDPDPAIAGSTFVASIGVQNLADDITSKLVIEFVPSYPFSLVDGETPIREVAAMQGYQGVYGVNQQVVKFNVMVDPSARAASYDLMLKYSSADKPGLSFNEVIPISVKNRESAEVIYIDKYLLSPGKADLLNFTINNVGSAPLRDLTFSWEDSTGVILPIGGSNSKYVKYLGVGESVNLTYQVMAAAGSTTGLYSIDLHLSYDDTINGSSKQVDTIAGIYVGGGTDFDVAFSDSSSGVTSFSIANIGRNTAGSILFSIPDQKAWKVTGANSVIVGNLNSGDYTVAGFKVTSTAAPFNANASPQGSGMPYGSNAAPSGNGSNRPGFNSMNAQANAPLVVEISYTDTLGDRQTIRKEVKMSASTTNSSFDSTAFTRNGAQPNPLLAYWPYLVVIVVVLVVGVVYLKRRKTKQKKDAKPPSEQKGR